MFQEDNRFTLPVGIVYNGTRLRQGTMRLSTARDEILAASDPIIKQNPDNIGVLLLARVITQFDGYDKPVTPELIYSLAIADYTFLQQMYTTINEPEEMRMRVTCPKCGERFFETVNFTQPD